MHEDAEEPMRNSSVYFIIRIRIWWQGKESDVKLWINSSGGDDDDDCELSLWSVWVDVVENMCTARESTARDRESNIKSFR